MSSNIPGQTFISSDKGLQDAREMLGDPVNAPPHYRTGNIEVIDFIEDQKLNYHLGNVVKYICRSPHKGKPLEDLKKAEWYLRRCIEKMEGS